MKVLFTSVLAALFLLAPAAAETSPATSLSDSPRHHEWVSVTHGERTVRAYVVYPEKEAAAPGVVVIHENRGLTDWVRTVADRLGAEGYVAIAPDLLSGTAPGGGGTSDYADSDAAREGIYKLSDEQVTADLQAVTDYVKKLPGANGTVSVMGFCWGGSQTFRFATNRPDLTAAHVFYGRGPDDKEAIGRIKAPVYGFYGGADERVNATIPTSAELMKEMGKTYETVIYPGAGHGFMRSGEADDASTENKEARAAAWERLLALLAKS